MSLPKSFILSGIVIGIALVIVGVVLVIISTMIGGIICLVLGVIVAVLFIILYFKAGASEYSVSPSPPRQVFHATAFDSVTPCPPGMMSSFEGCVPKPPDVMQQSSAFDPSEPIAKPFIYRDGRHKTDQFATATEVLNGKSTTIEIPVEPMVRPRPSSYDHVQHDTPTYHNHVRYVSHWSDS